MKKQIAKLLNCYIAKTENNNLTMKQYNNRPGFTLIELLIVIAVLGILITGILVVLNPVEQTRRANDAQRASAIGQLATAVTAYQTSLLKQDFVGLDVNDWQTALVNAQEIKQVITVPTPGGTPCSSRRQGNVCQITTTGTNIDIAIWAILDSKADWQRAGCTTSDPTAIVAYISSQQKTGIGCITSTTATENNAGKSILAPDFPLK